MRQNPERHREQSEHNRCFYEYLDANLSGYVDWKVNALFYSALHRINYWFAVQTGQAPESHSARNRRVRHELPHLFKDYRDLFMMSMEARYRDGHKMDDSRRQVAVELLERIEIEIPFR